MFHERAEKVEHALAIWNQLLRQAALPAGPTGNVLETRAAVAADADRRFSVYLDKGLDQDATEDEQQVARAGVAPPVRILLVTARGRVRS